MVEKTQMTGFWPQMFEPFRSFGARIAEWVAPASEASSDAGAYRIAIELPGVAEEDIHLSVEGGVVTVRGEKRSEREETGETWYFSERQYGAFARSFRLPEDADAEAVTAALKDGVLTVTLPRRARPGSGARRVPIGKG
jgi:HSP20 family protein